MGVIMKVVGIVLILAVSGASWGQEVEGQLSTSPAEADTSFQLDSRGAITTIQGATPKEELLEDHQQLLEIFESEVAQAQLTYDAETNPQHSLVTLYQWAYEVNAPSTGDQKSQVERREEDGIIRGRYSLVEPDGSLRIVTYIAHPDEGFQATVDKKNIVQDPLDSQSPAVLTYNSNQELYRPLEQQPNRPQGNLQQHRQEQYINQRDQSNQQQRLLQYRDQEGRFDQQNKQQQYNNQQTQLNQRQRPQQYRDQQSLSVEQLREQQSKSQQIQLDQEQRQHQYRDSQDRVDQQRLNQYRGQQTQLIQQQRQNQYLDQQEQFSNQQRTQQYKNQQDWLNQRQRSKQYRYQEDQSDQQQRSKQYRDQQEQHDEQHWQQQYKSHQNRYKQQNRNPIHQQRTGNQPLLPMITGHQQQYTNRQEQQRQIDDRQSEMSQQHNTNQQEEWQQYNYRQSQQQQRQQQSNIQQQQQYINRQHPEDINRPHIQSYDRQQQHYNNKQIFPIALKQQRSQHQQRYSEETSQSMSHWEENDTQEQNKPAQYRENQFEVHRQDSPGQPSRLVQQNNGHYNVVPIILRQVRDTEEKED